MHRDEVLIVPSGDGVKTELSEKRHDERGSLRATAL